MTMHKFVTEKIVRNKIIWAYDRKARKSCQRVQGWLKLKKMNELKSRVFRRNLKNGECENLYLGKNQMEKIPLLANHLPVKNLTEIYNSCYRRRIF